MTTNYTNSHIKLFNHLDRLHELKNGEMTAAPVNVELDLSWRCSLGCRFCHFAHTHTKGPLAGADKPDGFSQAGDLIDTYLAQSIQSQLESLGVRSITYSGGGEPTLHPDFKEIVLSTRLDRGLYTHGGHITEELAEVIKGNFTWVHISLDYDQPGTYAANKNTTEKFFHNVITGVTRLVQAPGKATIGLGFLIGPDNWGRPYHMANLGADLGVDYVGFRPLIDYDVKHPGRAGDVSWINKAIPVLQTAGNYSGNRVRLEFDIDRFRDYRDWASHGYGVCRWSAIQTVITPDGRLWTCVNKRGIGDPLGDLTKESFADIWQRAGKPCVVDGACRVMCKGHIPNLSLNEIMKRGSHANFV